MKLSPTQQDVVSTLQAQQVWRLVWLSGGFWTWDGCPVNELGWPTWWVSLRTVHALERLRVVVRAQEPGVPEWRDARILHGFYRRAGE